MLLLFFKNSLLNPRKTGALFPSSTYLTHAMSHEIIPNQSGYVVELGPGTGVVTQAIRDDGTADDHIISIEIGHDFALELSEKFPKINIIEGDATRLSDFVKDKPVHTIISSLPLLSIPHAAREKIFSEVEKVLMPGGRFIQFTYSLKKDTHFYPKSFQLIKSFIIWRNLPPARVMVFEIDTKSTV